nr:unnamed protein product [Spirometra erinaceieuropaei]
MQSSFDVFHLGLRWLPSSIVHGWLSSIYSSLFDRPVTVTGTVGRCFTWDSVAVLETLVTFCDPGKMRRFQFSTKQFEEILNSDDLFLDYFNVFLRIPTFPVSASYDRLLGCFLTETKDEETASFKRMFGATDNERECMLDWARKYRLVHFLETDLFREFKLCKLLRQSVEKVPCNACPSLSDWQYREQKKSESLGLLFGYDSWEDSSSLAVDSSIEVTVEKMRPRETPIATSSDYDNCYIKTTISAFLPEMHKSAMTEPSSEITLANSRSWEGGEPDKEEGSNDDGAVTRHSSRRWLTPSGHTTEDWRTDVQWKDCHHGTGTADEVEETSGEELVNELSHLEERQRLGIQQIKEFLLADREGMQDFLHFLVPTRGIHLVKFWMDCEAILSHIKDSLSDHYLLEHVQNARTLERTYESFLPRSTHALLLNAVTCFSRAVTTDKGIDVVETKDTETLVFLGCANLDRAQYAVVKRLRSYWLPRWLLHWEMRLLPMQLSPNPAWLSMAVDLSAGNEELVTLHIQCDVSAEGDGNRRELTQHRLYPPPRSTLSWDSEDSFHVPKSIAERNLDLLPFLCRLVLAWSLPSDVESVVVLLSDGSIDWKTLNAHLPRERTLTLTNLYTNPNKSTDSSVFRIDFVPDAVVFERLRAAVFTDFKCGRPFFKFASRTASQTQINSFHFIERLLNLFTATYRAHANRTDIAALSWVLLNQFIKQTAKFGLVATRVEDTGIVILTYKSSLSSDATVQGIDTSEVRTRTRLLLLFQTDLNDVASPFKASRSPEENQQVLNSLALLLKITDFLALLNPENRPDLTKLRSEKASEIHSTFLSSSAQKPVDLPQNLRQLLEKDKEHPKTSVLQSLRQHLIEQLNQPFADWVKVRSAEVGMSPRSFIRIQGNQLFETSRVTTARISKSAYRVEPTLTDRQELSKLLERCVFHPLTFQVLLFYQFLSKHGASEGRPFADNDLIFYIESLRFKELVLDKADHGLINHKLACIRSAFLESAFPPSMQVSLKSETGSRLLRGISRTLAPKGTPAQATLMDEARMKVFRELLPFWAAFRRNVRGSHHLQSAARMNLYLSILTGNQSEVIAQRLNMFRNWTVPPPPSVLPVSPEKFQSAGVSCSLAHGISWRAPPRRSPKPNL